MSSERQQLNTKSPWWGEHVHRYDEVIKELRGNERILDIACGTGFGSDLLSQKTKNQVTGGDIDTEAVNECTDRWDNLNLEFKVLDGTNLSYEDEYFDTVVSFETIEHTAQYEAMLSEFNRVLKSDGTAFISTPNFLISSPKGILVNPYHTQEFLYEELKEILEKTFSSVVIFGQKYTRYTDKLRKNRLAKVMESILYQRGVRKLPIKFQDWIMRIFIKRDLYPYPDDYAMITDIAEIKKCKTFFAICKK